MKLAICGLAFGLGFGLLAPAAFADPIESITFSGVAGAGSSESTGIFANKAGSLNGDAFSVTVSYNPAQLTNNNPNCGTSCYFSFLPGSSETEIVTVNSITQTNIESYNSNDYVRFVVTGTAGNYTDTIDLNIAGNEFQLTTALPDKNSAPLFSSETNLNSPYVLNNVNSQVLTGATFTTNVTSANSYNINNSSATPLVLTTSNVPEPASLGLLGAGLVALGFVRRRKVSAASGLLPA